MTTEQEVEPDVQSGSDNVFADLRLPSAGEDLIKANIAMAISATIAKRKLTQVAAGALIGVDQAKVSALLRGRLSGFSVERLLSFLVKLGRDVEITISREHRNREGRVRVKADAA